MQEASKSREAVAVAAVDAVVGDLAFEIEIICHSKAVGVDEEFVHVLLRAVMQPGLGFETVEGLVDGTRETFCRTPGICSRGTGVVGSGGSGGGGVSSVFGTDLFVGLPVCLLAFAGAVAGRLAFGAAFKLDASVRVCFGARSTGWLCIRCIRHRRCYGMDMEARNPVLILRMTRAGTKYVNDVA